MSDLFDLTGQNVLITGASRGIGLACAQALRAAGARICLVLRSPASASAVLAEHFPNTDTQTVICDLADTEAVKHVFDAALEKMGEIHILVNCAGIQRRAPSTEFPEQDWNDVLTTNLTTPFLLSQAAGRHMVPRRRGKIINFCSLLSFQGGLTVPAYAAAKGGLAQLTKALSNEWSEHNIQVNGIVPGYIDTDMNTALLTSPRLPSITQRIPAGRWGTPADFAGPIVFLASKASDYVCGSLLTVDGVSYISPSLLLCCFHSPLQLILFIIHTPFFLYFAPFAPFNKLDADIPYSPTLA